MAKLQLFAKGGLIVLIVVSIGVLIERLTDARHSWITDLGDTSNRVVMINTTLSPTADIVESIFSEDFAKCLTEHSKFHYYPISHVKINSSCLPHGKCIHNFLTDLSKLMESLGIKLHLLEPSLLFCMLPSTRKYNLLTRGFNSKKFQGSRNVVTFGIHQPDSEILDEASARRKLISAGCRILKFERLINSDQMNRDGSGSVEISHYFIVRQDLLMHLIVFCSRGSYLWSPGFVTSEISLKGLQYVNDSAFENFTVSAVHLDTLSTAQIFLPSDTRCFLLDMMSSNFLECEAASEGIPNVNTKVLIALKELKAILASQMVTFWLWSKSLQGWFEKCDILHYSEELKFSVAAKSVEGFNFTFLFTSSECQVIENNFILNKIINVKLKCQGVSIDLIFLYEDEITYWYEYVDVQNTYRLKFPKFTVCSTEIFGQKISIPCETSEIFEKEFFKNATLSVVNAENMLLMDKT